MRALFSASLVILAGALVLAPTAIFGTGGVYTQTRHADPSAGVLRVTSWPRGDCAQCHEQHDGTTPNPFALFAPNTNGLCYTSGCHSASGVNAIFQGPTVYDASRHATSTSMLWPGADSTVDASAPRARPAGDAGKCVNCHDVHGYNLDGTGLIPNLAVSREEKLCHVCHDGAPAGKNVKAEFAKTYRHPVELSGKHSAGENGTAAAFASPSNRHSECDDCHNSHVARPDAPAPAPPAASNHIAGVSRIAVTNGAAGTAPAYTYRGPADPTPAMEYEVCFKCHSSWTTQPAGQSNTALEFNPNNPSYHPVEAVGKNININVNAFVSGWLPSARMYCTDCHTSDNVTVRGPHGSQFRYILKKAYTASSASRAMSSTESCFDCHRYDTYANNGATNTIKGYSRFNPPAISQGHTFHVGNRQRPCYACHDSHASTTRPHLIVTGRNPGLNAYTETPTGGSCSPTCHGTATYTLNYPR